MNRSVRFGVFRATGVAEPPDPRPEIRRVAEAIQPDESAYGQTAWDAATATVLYVAWDGQPFKTLENAFMAIPGVRGFECDYESPPVGWFDAEPVWPDRLPLWLTDHPREATLAEIVQLAALPLDGEVFDFNPDQARGEDGKWVDEGKGGDKPAAEGNVGWNQMADIGERQKYDELKTKWARLDGKLLKYTGDPTDKHAEKIIDKQLETMQEIHALNIDKGNAEGIGLPGGPRDVVVVGAGPAGLQASIYGGAEGLDTLMVDQSTEPGGQIELTSRTENVLGFPAGVTGDQLAHDGLLQAERLGADTKLGVGVTNMSYNPDTGMKTLSLSDGSTVDARSVIIAGGVQFNQLTFPGSDAKGVIYGDSAAIKENGGPAVFVGGGNSAGQAAVDVADNKQDVTLLVRGDEGALKESMSSYLTDQLQNTPNIDIRYKSEIASASADSKGNLQSVTLKDGTEIPTDNLGVFIGSSPRTDWAAGVTRDERGYIETGKNGADPLETNIPGVFAAGDVRSDSMHRVIGAAGDGGNALATAYRYVNEKFGAAPKAETASAEVFARKQRPGDDFLMRVRALDQQQPFTGFDPDAPTVIPHEHVPAKTKRASITRTVFRR